MTWYFVKCLDCTPDFNRSFATPDERGAWAAEHTAGTRPPHSTQTWEEEK